MQKRNTMRMALAGLVAAMAAMQCNSLLAENHHAANSAVDASIVSSSDIDGSGLVSVQAETEPLPTPTIAPQTDAVAPQTDAVAPQVEDQTAPPSEDAAPLTPPPPSINRRAMLGAVAAGFSAAPSMIGDDFGGTFLKIPGTDSLVSLGGGDRRFKIAENSSPLPRHRIFFNYNHYHNTFLDPNGVEQNRNRYTIGVERTFLDDMASFELRLPISRTLDATQQLLSPDTMSGEFGNIGLSIKAILYQRRNWLIAGGTTMTLPTGDDYRMLNGGALLFDVDNEAVHIAPYLGLLVLGRGDYFLQGFVQTDFDLCGSDVRTGAGFQGVLQEQNLLFVDVALGRWFYRNRDRNACLNAVALIGELHYTSTMNDADTVAGITNPLNRVDMLNATGALHFRFGQTTIRVGAASPLREENDRMFDAEVMVQVNRFY